MQGQEEPQKWRLVGGWPELPERRWAMEVDPDVFSPRWHGGRMPFGVSVRAVKGRDRAWGRELRLVKRGSDVSSCLANTPEWDAEDSYCARWCGAGTWHAGAGKCARHGGSTRDGNVEGWLMMVHAFARYEEVTPWEALLREVSRSNGAVEWLQRKIGEAPDDESLLPDGAFGSWVKMWAEQRKHALAVYKATMDIGVDRILAEQNRIDGERMAQVLSAGLEAGDLTDDQRAAITSAMRTALEAQGAQERVRTEIEGRRTSEDG